jgi:hypothetical protein
MQISSLQTHGGGGIIIRNIWEEVNNLPTISYYLFISVSKKPRSKRWNFKILKS